MTEIQGLESLAPAVEDIQIAEVPDYDDSHDREAAIAKAEPELFDPEPFSIAPKVDGQTADKIVIRFGGSVSWDATDAEGRALYDKLMLGQDVELRVAGHVATKKGAYKLNATTEEEIVTGEAGIKIDTVYVLPPEALG